MSLGVTFLGLLKNTLLDPARVARRLLDWPMPQQAVWLALGLSAVLSFMVLRLSVMVLGVNSDGGAAPFVSAYLKLFENPLLGLALQAASTLALALVMTGAGLILRQRLNFPGALRLSIWVQLAVTAGTVAELLLFLVSPIAGKMLGILVLLLIARLIVMSTAELYQPLSPLAAIVGLVASYIGLVLLLSFLLMLVGFQPPGMVGA
ncbi:MAG: hypothetical protein WBA91_03255 [Paracoccaceae bacterium]